MSSISKKVNAYFKLAIKKDIEYIENELILDENLQKIMKMFYVEHKSIDYIAYVMKYSKSKIDKDLQLIRLILSNNLKL